jgi:hypothetical protein
MTQEIEAERLRAEVAQTKKRKDRPGRASTGSCEEGRKETNLPLGKMGIDVKAKNLLTFPARSPVKVK